MIRSDVSFQIIVTYKFPPAIGAIVRKAFFMFS